MSYPEDPNLPPPLPPFATPTDLDPADEVHVPLDEEVVLGSDTVPEDVEYLGDFVSLEAYFRSILEDQINPAVHWLMDCLDWESVQAKMEGGRFRYAIENGSVYRMEVL
jgi:hypothetical protein